MSVRLHAAASKLLDDRKYRGVSGNGASNHVGEDTNDIVVEFEVSDAAKRCGEQCVFAGLGCAAAG